MQPFYRLFNQHLSDSQISHNIELYTKDYLVKNAKANLLIVHGLHEHQERYHHVAKSLNDIGVNVLL
ncbi:MAG: alpha/beta hydrolase [Saprospiraceae bacterium]|nr:alpha/beta hydrolase [Saprospiraceae bacterium]